MVKQGAQDQYTLGDDRHSVLFTIYLGNAKNILQFKSCLYLSQNSLNQNLISDEDGQVYIHLEENLLRRRLMSINCLIPLDSSFYHD